MPKKEPLLSRIWGSAKSNARKIFGFPTFASNKVAPEAPPATKAESGKNNSHEEILEFLCKKFVSQDRKDEGVFRLSITQRKLSEYKKQLLTKDLKGDNPLVLDETETESLALAALIKPFFKEYIEQIQELKEAIIKMSDNMSKYPPDTKMSAEITAIRAEIVQLLEKYPVVKKVAESFVHAEKFSEDNKMRFSNLAIVLGPNLFDSGTDLALMQKTNFFAQFLLETAKEVNEEKQKATGGAVPETLQDVPETAKFEKKKSDIIKYLDLCSQESGGKEEEIQILEQNLGSEIIDKLFYAISDSQQTQNGAKYDYAKYDYLKINHKLIEEVKQAIARSRNDEELNLALAPSFTNQPAPEPPSEEHEELDNKNDSGIESGGEEGNTPPPTTLSQTTGAKAAANSLEKGKPTYI